MKVTATIIHAVVIAVANAQEGAGKPNKKTDYLRALEEIEATSVLSSLSLSLPAGIAGPVVDVADVSVQSTKAGKTEGATKLSYINDWESTAYQGDVGGAGGRIETDCTKLFLGHDLQGVPVGIVCFNDFLDFTPSSGTPPALYVDESANYYFPGTNSFGDSLSYRLAFQSQTGSSSFPSGLVLDQKFTSGSGKFWDSYQAGSLHLEVGVLDNIRRVTFHGVKL
jgi:hypothetical protein